MLSGDGRSCAPAAGPGPSQPHVRDCVPRAASADPTAAAGGRCALHMACSRPRPFMELRQVNASRTPGVTLSRQGLRRLHSGVSRQAFCAPVPELSNWSLTRFAQLHRLHPASPYEPKGLPSPYRAPPSGWANCAMCKPGLALNQPLLLVRDARSNVQATVLLSTISRSFSGCRCPTDAQQPQLQHGAGPRILAPLKGQAAGGLPS